MKREQKKIIITIMISNAMPIILLLISIRSLGFPNGWLYPYIDSAAQL